MPMTAQPFVGKQLNAEQANQPQTGLRDHRLSECRLGEANSLQTDGGDRRERGVLEAQAIGDLRREGMRHGDDLGVWPVAHDAISDAEAFNAGTNLQNNAGVAVSERDRRAELSLHGLEGRDDAVGANLRQYVADFVGLTARFVEERAASELDEHALGAGGDERRSGFDDEARPVAPGSGTSSSVVSPVSNR